MFVQLAQVPQVATPGPRLSQSNFFSFCFLFNQRHLSGLGLAAKVEERRVIATSHLGESFIAFRDVPLRNVTLESLDSMTMAFPSAQSQQLRAFDPVVKKIDNNKNHFVETNAHRAFLLPIMIITLRSPWIFGLTPHQRIRRYHP
ncbi:hypothetical protein CGRA01v4_01229 [Colletotrichum graminicola]|nr:hypothetical protein CGRA01v4_01229 [Colletotrichum graminicola]